MIAQAHSINSQKHQDSPSACWHAEFLRMLPAIETHARIVFRHLKGDRRQEAIQEVTCNACQAFARLAEQGRADAATTTSLAKYAVAQFRDGRRVGSSRNVRDVCSVYCQRRKGVTVQPLYQWDDEEHEWQEILVEDRHCTPADLAASRIDFPAFLNTLSRRDRQIAETLATGESTSHVARLCGVSAARVSQLRGELKAAWGRFHEPATAELIPA